MQGWISIHRKIKAHWIYDEKPFNYFQAWIDILLEVNHKKTTIRFGSELIDVQPGQKVTSIRKLCKRWGWSNTKVCNFLNLLKSDGMIEFEKDSKKTVLTVINFEFYQSVLEKKHHKNITETTDKHTNNNVNNVNNDNKEIYTPEFELFWDLYPRKVDKKKALHAFIKVSKNYSLDLILDGTKRYANEVKRTNKKYIKYPSSFLNNESFLNDFVEGEDTDGKNEATQLAEEYGLEF